MKLFGRDETFFQYFGQLADCIGQAATLLEQLFQSPRDAAAIAARIKKVEQDGDAIIHTVNQRIDTSFVTPLDREDIHLLAKRLDNVIDLINGTARRVVMFHITEPRQGGAEMAAVLVRASAVIQSSVAELPKRDKLLANGRAMKALEEEGDAMYARYMEALFSGENATIEVVKWKEIYDALENAIDEAEDVSNVLESIALKNG